MSFQPHLSQEQLAAWIDREGLAFEIRSIIAPWHGWCPGEGRARWIDRLAYEIRLSPGALNEWNLPHGVAPHNPDNLTPEQITEGGLYRATELWERLPKGSQCWNGALWDDRVRADKVGFYQDVTYRVPITTPLPKPAPDVAQSLMPYPDAIGYWWYLIGDDQWEMARVETNPEWNGRLRVWHQGDEKMRSCHQGGCCWADLPDDLPSKYWIRVPTPTELTAALLALKTLLAAAETCQEHCYSDGMVHHKSFNTLAIGEAILGARHILSLAATANPKPEELGQ